MRQAKPLTPEEVPAVFHRFLDFENQRKGEIRRECQDCGEGKWVSAASTRTRAQTNRFTCRCKNCKPRTWLEIYEIHNPLFRKHVNINNQKLVAGKMHVFMVCRKCQKGDYILAGKARRENFSALCADCAGGHAQWLRKEEIPLDKQQYIDFDSQRSGKYYYTESFCHCFQCGKNPRWIRNGHIRRNQRHSCNDCKKIKSICPCGKPSLPGKPLCKPCHTATQNMKFAQGKAFRRKKKGAKARGKTCTLTRAEFVKVSSQPCLYCGVAWSKISRKNGAAWHHCGLDRVDSSKGYEMGNVVPACRMCNVIKQARQVDKWLAHCAKISSRRAHIKAELQALAA